MARAFGYVLALLYISTAVSAIPVEPRQIGDVACNVARLKTVAGLRQTTTAVNKLAASRQVDPNVADAATTAQTGLQGASAGIKTIAGALLTGQQAPAAARDQVAQGLLSAQSALGNITTTDSTVNSMVTDANTKLQNTINAGQDVLSQCGGGGGSASAAAAASATISSAASSASIAASDNSNSTDTTDTSNSSNSTDTTNVGDNSSSSTDTTDTTDNSNTTGTTDTNDGTGSTSGSATGASSNGGTATDSTDSNTGGASAASGSTSSGNAASGGLSAFGGLRNSRIFGKRQIGGIACNVARLQTVARLAQSSSAVGAVKSAASSDAAASAAADQASTALDSAKGGIAKIAAALVTGQQAPAADRDQVATGLNDAMTAISGVNSTDPNVTSAISTAQSKISSTIQAGQAVVSNC